MTFRSLTAAAIAVAGLIVASAQPAAAQRVPSPYRFVEETQSAGLFGAYIATDRGQANVGPGSGVALGGRYSIRLNGPFSIEGEALIFPTSRAVMGLEFTDTDTIPTQLGEANLSLLVLNGGLRFNVTGPRTYRRMMPYFLFAGGAAIRVASDTDANEGVPADARYNFGTSFAGQVGGGIEWFTSRQLTLRTDARVLFWQLKTPDAFVRAQDIAGEEWVQNYTVSVGASYRF